MRVRMHMTFRRANPRPCRITAHAISFGNYGMGVLTVGRPLV